MTTSATGRTSPLAAEPRPSEGASQRCGIVLRTFRRGGFTLIEILLTLVIISLIAGALIMNFGGMMGARRVADAGTQFESLLRMTRAEAANKGRRFALHTDPGTGSVSIVAELNPIEKPGDFEPYVGSGWPELAPNEVLKVTMCHMGIDPPAAGTSGIAAPEESTDASGATAFTDVIFQPDGSSDSATIELAQVNNDDGTRVHIEIQGITGKITTEVRPPTSDAKAAP